MNARHSPRIGNAFDHVNLRDIINPVESPELREAFKGADLSSPDVRAELRCRHPLTLRDYLVPTPAVIEALSLQLYLVDRRSPGTCFMAYPRFGKSSAMKLLARAMADVFPDRAYVSFSTLDHHTANPTHAYRDIALTLGLVGSKPADMGIERIIAFLWMKAAEVKGRHLVVGIDEAHRWSPAEWSGWLAITNVLYDRHGIRTTCFAWAQHQLKYRRTLMQVDGRTDLLVRFLPKPNVFRGVASRDDMAMVLRAYDEVTEFPRDSGYSYTRFFLPRAWEGRFRLAEYAEGIWGAFERAAKSIPEGLQVGMEWVSSVVEHLLLEYSERDAGAFRFQQADLDAAVASTDFADTVGTIQPPVPEAEKPAKKKADKGGAA